MAIVMAAMQSGDPTMNVDTPSALTIGGAAIAGLVWLLRLEGRVNLADARHADIKEDLKEIKDTLMKMARDV